MNRRHQLDLRYTHEVAAALRQMPTEFVPPLSGARDLSARLHCLKVLYDLDRDGQEPRPTPPAH